MSAAGSIGRKDFAYSGTLGKELPLSFGANFNDDPITRKNLKKSHTLGDKHVQHPDEREDLSRYPPQAAYDLNRTAMVTSAQSYGAGATGRHVVPREALDPSSPVVPPKASDETVLRFLGYFMEQIPESPDERTRVRKVALLFHCADETVLVREAAQVNSGMTQGVIFKRQRVPVGDRHVRMQDLDVGATVNVFGKAIKIVDCSEATRRYLVDVAKRSGVQDALPWPEDDTYNVHAAKKLTTQPRRQLPTTDFDHKRAMEAMRGSGIVSKHAPDDVRTAQQFLRNRINEHLQFAAYWDDRDKMSGDLRLVVIRYFLENDTIEIVESRPENSGREGAAKILCRQRVLHPKANVPPPGTIQQNTFGLLVKSEFITFDDLDVGININIAGRTYTTFDADEFTRNWYRTQRDKELAPAVDISAIIAKGTRPPPVQYPPPHTGFGSEEDSLRSCKALMLKPPRFDAAKAMETAGKILIFKARLENCQQPEDSGREFVVSFHLTNNEVEITERQLRNSGIVGGKFLAKGRHLRTLPDGRRVPYEASDFAVGGTVFIAGRTFRLESIDERSRRIAAGEVDEVSEDRVRSLIIAFREMLNSKYYRAHEAYRNVAPDGALTAEQLREFFAKGAADITIEEANHLLHYFSGGDGSGRISYDRFLKIMDPGNTHNLDEAVNNPRSVKGVTVLGRSTEEGRAQADDLRRSCDAAADEAASRRVRKSFASKLVQRRGTVQEAFRMLAGHAPNARLSREALAGSLDDVVRLAASDRERQLLLDFMYDTEEKRRVGLNFTQFCEFVEAQ